MSKAKIYGADFNRILDATKAFVSKNSVRTTYNYIRMEFDSALQRVTVVAVDGYRMSVEHSIIILCDEDFVAYIKPTFRLPSGEYAEISVDENICQVNCNGVIFGFEQPKSTDFLNWEEVIPKGDPTFKIAFDGNYLLDALKAAKTSAGSFKNPVVLQFFSPTSPAIIKTNKDDIKMILPVRIKD